MNLDTQVTVSPDLAAAMSGLKPAALVRAVTLGMRRGTLLIASAVQSQRLTGQGPFAPSQQRLGVVTGRLRRAVRATAPVVNGDQVMTSIGANVSYAAAHEFGFRGIVNVRAHEVTMTKLFGRKLKAPLRFTRLASKRKVNIRERRPFRAGIAENLAHLENEISRAVVDGITKGNRP